MVQVGIAAVRCLEFWTFVLTDFFFLIYTILPAQRPLEDVSVIVLLVELSKHDSCCCEALFLSQHWVISQCCTAIIITCLSFVSVKEEGKKLDTPRKYIWEYKKITCHWTAPPHPPVDMHYNHTTVHNSLHFNAWLNLHAWTFCLSFVAFRAPTTSGHKSTWTQCHNKCSGVSTLQCDTLRDTVW